MLRDDVDEERGADRRLPSRSASTQSLEDADDALFVPASLETIMATFAAGIAGAAAAPGPSGGRHAADDAAPASSMSSGTSTPTQATPAAAPPLIAGAHAATAGKAPLHRAPSSFSPAVIAQQIKPNAAPDSMRAWLVVVGCFVTQFATFGYLSSFGIYTTTFAEEFTPNSALVSLIGTVQLGGMFLGGSVNGKLSDRWGCRSVLTLGSVLWILGMFLGSASTQYWEIMLTQGVLCGLGTGLTYFSSISVLAMWFSPKRRGVAISIGTVGGGFGTLTWGLAGARLMDEVGWRDEMRIVGGIGAGLLLVGIVLIERRLPPMKTGGALEYNLRLLRTDAAYRSFLLALFLFMWAFFIPFAQLPTYIAIHGLGQDLVPVAVAMLGVGACVGRLMSGVVSNYLGRVHTIQVMCFSASMCMFLWPTATTASLVLAFAYFYGMFTAAFLSNLALVTANQWGPPNVSTILTLGNLIMVPGGMASAAIAGAWFDAVGSLLPVTMWAASMLFVSFLCLLLMKDKPEAPPPQGPTPAKTHAPAAPEQPSSAVTNV